MAEIPTRYSALIISVSEKVTERSILDRMVPGINNGSGGDKVDLGTYICVAYHREIDPIKSDFSLLDIDHLKQTKNERCFPTT